VSKVNVRYSIQVRGSIGGSFEISQSDFRRLSKALQDRRSSHQETDLAEDFMSLAPFNLFDHLNVDEMEIEQFDKVEERSRG
jgi:hypothetical protein